MTRAAYEAGGKKYVSAGLGPVVVDAKHLSPPPLTKPEGGVPDGMCVSDHEGEEIHVVPINDIVCHSHTACCSCSPVFDGIYIHHAADGRS